MHVADLHGACAAGCSRRVCWRKVVESCSIWQAAAKQRRTDQQKLSWGSFACGALAGANPHTAQEAQLSPRRRQ